MSNYTEVRKIGNTKNAFGYDLLVPAIQHLFNLLFLF